MKAYEFWALECFRRLCPHAPPDQPLNKSTTQQAYVEGFNKAKEMVINLFTKDMVPPYFKSEIKVEHVGTIVWGIGTVEVDPKTGERFEDE